MRYLSVCSGIEAATVAWHPLGWEPLAFAEVEKFPSAVLAHRHPTVPNYEDITKYAEWPSTEPNLLVGGTPCQSFSVAGLRKGMADPRGNLALVFLGIADRYRPEWLLWENVPGVLSSNSGRDFGAFLGALGQLGYGWAYRVLDAQHFGVPQRRRRVFVVGCLGEAGRAAAALFERHCLQGRPSPSRKAGQKIAASIVGGLAQSSPGGVIPITDRATRHSGGGPTRNGDGSGNGLGVGKEGDPCPTLTKADRHSIFVPVSEISHCPNAGAMARLDCETETMVIRQSNQGICATLNASGAGTMRPAGQGNELDFLVMDTPSASVFCASSHAGYKAGFGTLRAAGGDLGGGSEMLAVRQTENNRAVVRKLTPLECERLQGFPDGYTAIHWKGKSADECPDAPRYKALGNSMAVPVMRWIGERIQAVTSLEIASR